MTRWIDMTPEQQDAEIARINRQLTVKRIGVRISGASLMLVVLALVILWCIASCRANAAVSWSCSDGSRYWYAEFQTPKCQEGKLSEVNFNAPPIGYTETFDRDGHVVPEGQNSGR